MQQVCDGRKPESKMKDGLLQAFPATCATEQNEDTMEIQWFVSLYMKNLPSFSEMSFATYDDFLWVLNTPGP